MPVFGNWCLRPFVYRSGSGACNHVTSNFKEIYKLRLLYLAFQLCFQSSLLESTSVYLELSSCFHTILSRFGVLPSEITDRRTTFNQFGQPHYGRTLRTDILKSDIADMRKAYFRFTTPKNFYRICIQLS